MNIKDIEQYKTRENQIYKFSRRLEQTDPIILDIKEKFSKDQNNVWSSINQYLNKTYKDKYSLGWVSSSNGELTKVEVFEVGYEGYNVCIQYKGLTYSIYALKEGEINNISVAYWFMNSYTSHTELKGYNSIEECSQEVLKRIENDKQEVLKHYNKKIKELKADFKSKLHEVNSVIEGLR